LKIKYLKQKAVIIGLKNLEHKLVIYPTSRAIRYRAEESKICNGFLPTLMRIDEFESRCIILPKTVIVDSIHRVLLLQEASNFEEFKKLKVDKKLLKFFSRSDAFFKFFEELSAEYVDFDDLRYADSYAEFDEHLDILKRLRDRYEDILISKGLTDKAFIPKQYKLNRAFINNYTQFELHLEGYLTNYELSIINEVAKEKSFLIYIRTSKFNKKIVDIFINLGIELPLNYYICFDLHTKEVIKLEKIDSSLNSQVFRCEERLEQVALAIETIENFIQDGIPPEEIVLILPDESMKEQFKVYDKMNNFNFAMGFSYINNKIYKKLDALYRYWHSSDSKDFELLVSYNMNRDDVMSLSSTYKVTISGFFEILNNWNLFDNNNETISQYYIYFIKVFSNENMSIKNWLYLWLQILGDITIDDVDGGKITVMGVLESRGVSYSAVVMIDVNEGIVPVSVSKDRFLNTSVRAYAKLPTKSDRESLQKYFYQRVLEKTKKSVIFYTASDNSLPSKFLYELGLDDSLISCANLDILYNTQSKILEIKESPLISNFNATDYVWSPTMLKSFLSCKRHFYYKYIQKLKVPSDNDNINEGAILHQVLYMLFNQQRQFLNYNEIKEQFNKCLSNYIVSLNIKDIRYDYYSILWEKKLEGFLSSQIEHLSLGWGIKELEYKIKGDINGLSFQGVIDRIDIDDNNNIVVLDYKTGLTTKSNHKDIEKITDFQMSIYHNLLKVFNYSTIELLFVKLFEDGKYEPIDLHNKDEALIKHIDDIKELKDFIADKCDDLNNCRYCDYKLNCERDF